MNYFVNTEFTRPLKIFLLFNKLSEHKKTIYDSFFTALGDHAVVDFYIYNNDFLLFKRFMAARPDDYTHYVIIPHFIEGGDTAHEIINEIPKDKFLLLDKQIPSVTGIPATVSWNCVDMQPYFNADVRTIYKQKYISPRPNTVPGRIGTEVVGLMGITNMSSENKD